MASKRITKDLACKVAEEMLIGVEDKIKSKRGELSEFAIKLAISKVDKDLYEKILSIPKDWFDMRSYLYIGCEDSNLRARTIYLCREIRYNNTRIDVSREDYEKITALDKDIRSMDDEKDKLKNQIINTLLKLSTFKNVQEKYPEAYAHFPKDEIVIADPIALPTQSIQDNINKILNS